MKTIAVNSIDRPSTDVASAITEYLAKGRRVLWLVSGGSSMAVAVAAARQIDPGGTSRLTVTLTDERYGPVGHEDSNWQQLVDRGFAVAGATMLPVLKPNLDLEATTEQYADTLQSLVTDCDAVVGLFGVGVDGHIAGILPHSRALDSKEWAMCYEAPPFMRITMTPPLFSKLDTAWLYYSDRAKTAVVERLQQDDPVAEEPVQVIKQAAHVTIYTNQKEGK